MVRDKDPASMVETFLWRIGWLIVITAAVIISTWSLFILAHQDGHLPVYIAALVSSVYDGLAFVSSIQTLRWNREYASAGLSSRLVTVLYCGLSAWLNWNHAAIAHLPKPVAVMLAMTPVAGILALEIHLRFVHRVALKNAGREPVRKPEGIAWLLFPIRSYKVLRLAVLVRLERLTDPNWIPAIVMNKETARDARLWLRENGFNPPYKGPLSQDLFAIYAQSQANQNGTKPNSDAIEAYS